MGGGRDHENVLGPSSPFLCLYINAKPGAGAFVLPRLPHGRTRSLDSEGALLGFAGFLSQLSVTNPVLRLHLGCSQTCWIELSLQRELDFALLQDLRFGPPFWVPSAPMSASFLSPEAFQGLTWLLCELH